MQGQKKYYLNVSSYKYKRECMKLLSQSLDRSLIPHNNSEIISEFQNLCPGGKHCKNFVIILNLEQKIKSLNDTVNQLMKINEYSEYNHSRSFTPKKNTEPKRKDSFNEFCNSFRNSVKKRRMENNKNLIGNIAFPTQIEEPYKIKPYNSIPFESKVVSKKMYNKKQINIQISDINYKSQFNLKANNNNNNNINELYFLNKSDIKDDNLGKKEKEKLDCKIGEEYTKISSICNEEEDLKNKKKNVKINNNKCDFETEGKNIKKQNNKKNEEFLDKNEYDENINIKNIKNNIDEKLKNSNNKKEEKKNCSNNLPQIIKVKNYKLIPPLKLNKNHNQRYEVQLSERSALENKLLKRQENKLNLRKIKEKERNILHIPKNKFLSKSFGHNKQNKERNNNIFNITSIANINSQGLISKNKVTKIKINSFSNFKPLSLIQKPFKININQNLLHLNNEKINKIPKSENNKNKKCNTRNTNVSLSNSFEFKQFIKELECNDLEENNDKYQIYKELYDLTSYKIDILTEKLKSMQKEKIESYISFIKYSLKYIKDSTFLLQKFKLFHNITNNQKDKGINNDEINYKITLNEEFKNYKEESIKLIDCEDVYIYIYDFNSDCLKLKGEKEELEFQKDKDLIGLSFTSGKKIRYENDNNSNSINIPFLSKIKSKNIKNILIYPLKDKDDNIYGVIEAINKNQDKQRKLYMNNIDFYLDKPIFNKSDEIIMSLISKDLGNFCKYYNYINYINNYIFYYHTLLKFYEKLFSKKEKNEQSDIFYFLKEIYELFKIIFDVNEIQFLLYKNQTFYNIQKNKSVPLEGIVYKAFKEKKIIYTINTSLDDSYSNKSDLNLNVINLNKKEELITIPIFDKFNKNIVFIIQIKTSKLLESSSFYNNILSVKKEKLNEEIYFILENISNVIQKYFFDNIELLNN